MARLRKPHDLPGVVVAALFIALGVVLIRQTGSLSPMGSVFPITIAVAMIVFSALLIVRNVVIGARAAPAGAPEEPEAEDLRRTMPRRIAFFAAMALWIAALPVVGFFVTSLAGFFVVMAIALHERMPLREAVLMVVMGVIVVSGFYTVMREVLLIPMPRGLLF